VLGNALASADQRYFVQVPPKRSQRYFASNDKLLQNYHFVSLGEVFLDEAVKKAGPYMSDETPHATKKKLKETVITFMEIDRVLTNGENT
jgi:hypothetical protein